MYFVGFFGSNSPVEAVFSVFNFFGAMSATAYYGPSPQTRFQNSLCDTARQENREEHNEF